MTLIIIQQYFEESIEPGLISDNLYFIFLILICLFLNVLTIFLAFRNNKLEDF